MGKNMKPYWMHNNQEWTTSETLEEAIVHYIEEVLEESYETPLPFTAIFHRGVTIPVVVEPKSILDMVMSLAEDEYAAESSLCPHFPEPPEPTDEIVAATLTISKAIAGLPSRRLTIGESFEITVLSYSPSVSFIARPLPREEED